MSTLNDRKLIFEPYTNNFSPRRIETGLSSFDVDLAEHYIELAQVTLTTLTAMPQTKRHTVQLSIPMLPSHQSSTRALSSL